MELQQVKDAFSALDVQLVVVTFQGGPLVRAYLDETRFPWSILIDEERDVYRAYGMFQARLRHLWGPATWLEPAERGWLGGCKALLAQEPREREVVAKWPGIVFARNRLH